jgi:ADP-ribosylglycohydrolase
VTAEFHRIIADFSVIGDDVNQTAEKAGLPADAFQPNRKHSIEELPLALGFAVINKGDFRRSIEDGINSGRDTDSIGVMAGAILGAMQGEGVIGEADRLQLDRANRFDLRAEADRFTNAVTSILASDRDRATATLKAREALLSPTKSSKVA